MNAPSSNLLLLLAQRVRSDLRRHRFNARAREAVEFILDLSLGAGRPVARIPVLEDFRPVTGMTRNHVHPLLRRLVKAGVLAVRGDCYQVLPQSKLHHWATPLRVNPLECARALRRLDALNRAEQLELLEPLPDLDAALDAVLLEEAAAVATEPQFSVRTDRTEGTDRTNGTKDYIAALRAAVHEPVPEMGTTCSQKGNEPFPKWEQTGGKGVGTARVVPEMGTTCSQNGNKPFPKWEQLVPKTGTNPQLASKLSSVQDKAELRGRLIAAIGSSTYETFAQQWDAALAGDPACVERALHKLAWDQVHSPKGVRNAGGFLWRIVEAEAKGVRA